jgi:glutamyl-tRNA synthetase
MNWINETQPYDEKVTLKLKSKSADRILKGILNIVTDCNEVEALKDLLINWAEENEINIGVMMQCFRVALVGELSGPDLFEICKFLNKDIILIRISKAISYFKQKT